MSPRTKEYIALAVVLIAALATRLIFINDMVRGDALNYSHAAYELSQGRLQLDSWVGTERIGLYAPVAALYLLFGPSQVTTLFFPVVSSLLSIIFVFAIARMLGGLSAGLAAALIWAVLPLDVYLATILLPDGPMAAFCTGAVYFLFLWDRTTTKRRWTFFVVSLAMLVWALLIKPLAIISALFFLLFIASRTWKRVASQSQKHAIAELLHQKNGLIAFILLAALAWFIFAYIQPRPFLVALSRTAADLSNFLFLGATELDFSSIRFSQSILFVSLAPLFLVSVCFVFIRKRRQFAWLLIWLSVLFIYYEWGSVDLNPLTYFPLEPFNEARYLLFIMPPLVVIAAVYLSKPLDENKALPIIPTLMVLITGLAFLIKPDLSPGASPGWIEISGALLLVGTIVSPLYVTKGKVKNAWMFILLMLTMISIVSLKPVLPYHALMSVDRRQVLENARGLSLFFNENPTGSIYVKDRGMAMTMNYASDFQLGFDWAGIDLAEHDARIQVGQPPIGHQGFIVTSGDVSAMPSDWAYLISFGSDPETTLSVFSLSGSGE